MILECILLSASLCRAARDRPVLSLGVADGAVALADTIQTRRHLARGGIERDPLAVAIVRNPAAVYSLDVTEAIAGMWIAERLRRARGPIRHLWWIPQAVGIAAHGEGIAWTYTVGGWRL